jgi:hypothetical protein
MMMMMMWLAIGIRILWSDVRSIKGIGEVYAVSVIGNMLFFPASSQL